MPKQNPDQFLIKIGDGGDPTETFNTLCGLTSRNFTVGGDQIDVTTAPCDGSSGNIWQEMAHGVRNVSVSGSGFFESKAQVEQLVNAKLTGNGVVSFQVIVPGLGTFEGPFMVGDLGLGGDINGGNVTQEIALSSSGTITFTAEA